MNFRTVERDRRSSAAALGSPFGLEVCGTSPRTPVTSHRQVTPLRGFRYYSQVGRSAPVPPPFVTFRGRLRMTLTLRTSVQLAVTGRPSARTCSGLPASRIASLERSSSLGSRFRLASCCPSRSPSGVGRRHDSPVRVAAPLLHRHFQVAHSAPPSRHGTPGLPAQVSAPAGHESPLTPGHGTFLALNHPCTSGIGGRWFPSRLSILHPCPVGHAASPFVSQLVTGRPVTPPRNLHDRRAGDGNGRSRAALLPAPSPSAIVVFPPPWASVAG